ncbi:nucleoside phosphatase family-domain-containing protein [Chytridium lagenaria]|nr:nucleoside phosphatase family-domain-containing protein [Chytridium lagenaria]
MFMLRKVMASPKSRRRGSSGPGAYERLPTAYQGGSVNPNYVYPMRKIVTCGAVFAFCTLLLFVFFPSGDSQPSQAPIKNPYTNTSPSTDFHTPPPCQNPHPNRPLLQHAIMIDAGSTGSRIHIFHQLKPGLSSFADDPEGAAKSLDALMEKADEVVAVEERGCTPVAVKATAGLRLVGETKSKAILEAVRNRLGSKYKFKVIEGDEGVGVMDGKDEGVYSPFLS